MNSSRTLITSVSLAALAGVASAQPGCGGWEFVPSPDVNSYKNILYDADASSPSDVWAVGFSDEGSSGSTPKNLAMHWDGSGWTIVPTPNPLAGWNDIVGVAALGPDSAWAVGSSGSNNPRPTILRWDGSSWTDFDAGLGSAIGTCQAIHALAPDDIWTVGRFTGSALATHWDGSSWQVKSVPQVGGFRNVLQAVDAVAADDVWAGGFWSTGFGHFSPFAAHWDGSQWEAMEVPTPGAPSNINGIAAVGHNDVWAVGDYYDPQEGAQPFITHWDGSSWTRFVLPIFPGGPAELRAMVANGPDDIYAAGAHNPSGNAQIGLILHYDGTDWTIMDLPSSGGTVDWFRGMASLPGGETWAVGQHWLTNYTGTLTERLSTAGCCPADFNGDGSVNTLDVLAFLNAWSAGDPSADFNGDGSINTLDVLAFLNAWSAGC